MYFPCKGLLTPEPDEGLLNSPGLSTVGEAPHGGPQGCRSPLPQMIRGSQSRAQQLLRITSLAPRAPTPRPNRATVIVVKPYKGER